MRSLSLKCFLLLLVAGLIGWGTHPTKRAFYRAFRDFNPLNVLGIG